MNAAIPDAGPAHGSTRESEEASVAAGPAGEICATAAATVQLLQRVCYCSVCMAAFSSAIDSTARGWLQGKT